MHWETEKFMLNLLCRDGLELNAVSPIFIPAQDTQLGSNINSEQQLDCSRRAEGALLHSVFLSERP